jgi:hypothetical protein
MSQKQVVCDVFLWSLAAVYLFAFTSLYVQIPGTYCAILCYTLWCLKNISIYSNTREFKQAHGTRGVAPFDTTLTTVIEMSFN